jgi:hypothetical protein
MPYIRLQSQAPDLVNAELKPLKRHPKMGVEFVNLIDINRQQPVDKCVRLVAPIEKTNKCNQVILTKVQ